MGNTNLQATAGCQWGAADTPCPALVALGRKRPPRAPELGGSQQAPWAPGFWEEIAFGFNIPASPMRPVGTGTLTGKKCVLVSVRSLQEEKQAWARVK